MRALPAIATALGLAVAATVVGAGVAPLPERLSTASSPVVTWQDGQTAHTALAPDDRWRVAVTPEDVDPDMVHALLAFEDARFAWHPGVDPVAVARAVITNLRRGRVVSGASTLTMQLVRVLEPRPRTLTAKAIEAWRAVGMSARLSKEEVLGAYLTFAPYGRNVEGVEAAARAWFGHGADALAPDEIAVLLAVPQDPTHRVPGSAALRAGRDEVARRLHASGAWDDATLELAIRAPLPTAWHPFPRQVPHVAAFLSQASPGAQRVHTTLDAATQRTAERVMERYAPARAAQGIRHATILVVDPATGAVRAAVGNTSWDVHAPGSQIAAFDVPRSPGSALKPLVYALALQGGLVLPDTRVPDVPIRFGSWAPTNYDGGWDGLVRTEDALARSLNIPFVALLGDLGVERFVGVLAQAGVTSLDPAPGHYGLSAAVGGIELTPVELAQLYTALAGDGRVHPLAWRVDALAPAGVALTSPGAAWLTRRALRLRDRPDFPTRKEVSALPPSIAWKTGTSFGHRDAWAVGFDADHLVVVWLGNLDQTPSRYLVGADAAGEILFDVLQGLTDPTQAAAEDPRPSDLGVVTVCSLSGHLPGAACPQTERVQALTGQVPSEPCPFHTAVEVDTLSGLAVRPGCREGRDTSVRSFVQWPAAVRRWLVDRRQSLPEVPAWAPGCTPSRQGPPRILRPAPGEVSVLTPGMPAHTQEVPLEARVDRAGAQVSWFIDQRFLGTVAATEPLWWTPTPGSHRVTVVDDTGESATSTLIVRADP